jgi:hypothetical protein
MERVIDVGGVGDGHLGEGLTRRGIYQLDVLLALGSDGLAPDKIVQTAHIPLQVTDRLSAMP